MKLEYNKVGKIWWLNPIYLYFCWVLFSFYCFTIDDDKFYDLYGLKNYINVYYLSIIVTFFFVFILGFITIRKSKLDVLTINDYSLNKISKINNVYFYIVLFAYVVWFGNIILNEGKDIILNLILNITGYASYFRNNDSGRISGITTCTELGIIVAPVYTFLYLITHEKIYKKRVIILIVIAFIRSLIFAERLAFIELVVPSFVIYCYFGKLIKKKFIQLLPLLGVVILLFMFGSMEYFRSWHHYKEIYDGNIVRFTIDRVFGYYSVAFNTEAIVIQYDNLKFFPYNELEWLWQLPGFSSLKNDLLGQNNLMTLLETYGNPEYNNPGGFLVAYRDFGWFGIIVQYIIGLLFGLFYKGYLKHSFILSIWYSITFLCIIELPRYFFWGNVRAFFVIFGLLIFQMYINKNKSKSYEGNLH